MRELFRPSRPDSIETLGADEYLYVRNLLFRPSRPDSIETMNRLPISILSCADIVPAF